MKLWLRRTYGILALGGGAIGFAVTLQYVLTSSNVLDWLFCAVFLALYGWGVWCGLRLIEGARGAEHANAIFWLVQVPYVISPVIGYLFSAGLHVTPYVQFSPLEFKAFFRIGSTMQYTFMQGFQPFALGVNVFALGSAWYLDRVARRIDAAAATVAQVEAARPVPSTEPA